MQRFSEKHLFRYVLAHVLAHFYLPHHATSLLFFTRLSHRAISKKEGEMQRDG